MEGAIIKGFLAGLWLSFSFGPVFFALIQESIEKGVKQALWFDLGVLLSDLFYIFLAFWGASFIMGNEQYRFIIGLAGGILLLGFGLAPFFKKKYVTEEVSVTPIAPTRKGLAGAVLKGFMMNLLNPSVLFIWFAATSLAFTTFSGSKSLIIIYFLATLLTYFGLDVAKVYLALKLKPLLKRSILDGINKLSGAVILGFGAYLLFQTFKK
ncbi:MAG: LysE family translocator [Bacteroidia bacterium]|jgi:threonine/homoserine/homoserine lactone efflux protein